jgi:hypothetical protein
MIKDPSIRNAVLDLLIAERLRVNDSLLAELSAKIEEKKRAIDGEKEQLKKNLKEKGKELISLTGPVIRKAVEKLHREITGVRLERKMLGRAPGDFSMVNKLIIETNEDSMQTLQRIVRDAVETLGHMECESIKKIEGFVEGELKKIQAVDLNPVTKKVSEEEYARKQFLASPAGSGRMAQ